MSECDEPDSLRRVVEHLLSVAQRQLCLSAAALRRLIAMPAVSRSPDERIAYQALGSLADSAMHRRPLAPGVVDGFYSSAREGHRGEEAFAGGVEALLMHGYSRRVISKLPSDAISRFLGLGNVWVGVGQLHNKRVIDVGCGSGVDLGVAACLAARSAFLVGVDKRPNLLEVAAKACPAAALIVGDIDALPLADGTFDVVLANGLPPLQRPATLAATAGALHRLAVPGGTIAATVIIASSVLTSGLADAFPSDGIAFARGLATLISGKPTGQDVMAAFEAPGAAVTQQRGNNPYCEIAPRARTEMFTVTATRR